MPNTKNFGYSTVLTAPSPATSGTSLVVQSADGAKFPSTPFNATVWPAGAQALSSNAEIVTVTAISTDTFTIVRGAESSSARSILVGDQIDASITAGLFPTGTIVGTTDAQTVSGKILSDAFMGDTYINQSGSKETLTLPASTDSLAVNVLEVAAANTLEIPVTSTLEIFAPPVANSGALTPAALSRSSFSATSAFTSGSAAPAGTGTAMTCVYNFLANVPYMIFIQSSNANSAGIWQFSYSVSGSGTQTGLSHGRFGGASGEQAAFNFNNIYTPSVGGNQTITVTATLVTTGSASWDDVGVIVMPLIN